MIAIVFRSILLFVFICLPAFAQDFSASAARQFRTPGRVRLHGLPVLVQSAKVWNDGETVTWNGIVDSPLPGSFSLAITGSHVAGHLSSASGDAYEISGTPDQLIYTKQASAAPFLCPIVPDPSPVTSKSAPLQPRQVGSDPELDILVVYTAAARARNGSESGMLNRIRGAVAFTNQAFANSGVAASLNLVGAKEVNISESGSCGFDLAQLTNQATTSGGFLENLRNETGADLVSLFIASGDCGGVAYLLTNPAGIPNSGLSLTALDSPNPNFTFAHEIGHNLGANHDRFNAGPTPGLFPYSYGYQNTTAEPYFRDLIAYECIGTPCPRQALFSSPAVSVLGRPLGVAAGSANSADAVSTFNLSAPVVANYRPRNPNPNPNNFVSSFGFSPEEVNAPINGGTVLVTVRSNVAWSVATNTDWFFLPTTTGNPGETVLTLNIPRNPGIGPRSTTLEFRGEGLQQYFNLRQAGVTAEFPVSVLTVAAEPASGQIRLTLSDESFAWAINPQRIPSWLSLSPLNGVGSRTISYSAAANLTGASRQANISFLGPSPEALSILQSRGKIEPAGPLVTLPAAGGASAFVVNLGGVLDTWTVLPTSVGNWLSATPNREFFDRLVTFSAPPNPRSADRRGTISVGSQNITVVQRGQRCTLSSPIALGSTTNASLAPSPACGSSYLSDSLRVAYTNRYTFSASAGQSVRILMESSAVDSVLYLTGPDGELLFQDDNSGGGNNAAIPNLSNFLTLPAAGTYTIEATAYSLGAFTLRLLSGTPAAPAALAPAINLPNTAGSGSFALTLSPAGLAWAAAVSSVGEWLQLTNPSGTGNTTVTYRYFANPSTSPRVATIQIAGQSFTITQGASPLPVLRRGDRLFNPVAGPETRDTGPLFSISNQPTLTFHFSHSAGFEKLDVVNVLLNTALDGGRACYIAYSRTANVLYLVDDAGPDVGLSALILGSNSLVSNSQCTIFGNQSSAVGSGNHLSLTLRIDFKPAFAGHKVIYLAARDAASGNSGWRTHGGIAIPNLPASFPRSGTLLPAVSTELNSGLSARFQHEGSINNIGTAWILINTSVDARNACYIAYFVPGRLLLLLPDNGDPAQALSKPIATSGSLENSQCRVVTGFGAYTTDGELVVPLSLVFKAPFQQLPLGVWTAAQTLGVPGSPPKTSPWSLVGGRMIYLDPNLIQ